MTPYEATFGVKARVGLESYLPASIFGKGSDILTEEQLEELLNDVSQSSQDSELAIPDESQVKLECPSSVSSADESFNNVPSSSKSCYICYKEAGSHICQKCNRTCHPFWEKTVEEGYDGAVICNTCLRNEQISERQSKCTFSVHWLNLQTRFSFSFKAQTMLNKGMQRLDPLKVGDSVRIPVNLVDRSRSTARNLLGVILDEPRTGQPNIIFKVFLHLSQSGSLQSWYKKSSFECFTTPRSNRKGGWLWICYYSRRSRNRTFRSRSNKSRGTRRWSRIHEMLLYRSMQNKCLQM